MEADQMSPFYSGRRRRGAVENSVGGRQYCVLFYKDTATVIHN